MFDDPADAIEIIRKYFEGPIRPYMTVDFGRRKKGSAISLVPPYPPQMNSTRLLETLQNELPEGYVAFLGTNHWLGDEKFFGSELVVAQLYSQYSALRLAETSGLNQGISTQDIVETLQEFDREYGLCIRTATTDTVVFELDRLPNDIGKFLDDLESRLKAPCEPRAEVIAEIETTGLVGLWWD